MLSDKEIIIRIKNGEINYYSYIVNKYTFLIYRYIEIKIKRREDVEDLIQNIFISFYKAIDRFDENKPIKPYLFQIAKNELKMFYRKHKTLLSINDNIIAEEKEIIDFDKDLLSSLKNEEKEILTMLIDGYSYQDISEKFKKPLNTVKSIIRRARNKLKINS